MPYKFRAGFTLIELLVVIAIIGMLSAIVLASLSEARTHAKESAIKSNLQNMIPEVELMASTDGDYHRVNDCKNSDSPLYKFVSAVEASGGSISCFSLGTSGSTFTRWGASVVFTENNEDKYFSVDSQGVVTMQYRAQFSGSYYDAVAGCSSLGERVPSAEQLKALADTGPFPNGYIWSSSEDPTNSANAYVPHLNNKLVYDKSKTQGGYKIFCES